MEGVAKDVSDKSQGGGSFASVNRFAADDDGDGDDDDDDDDYEDIDDNEKQSALLCWLVCCCVTGVAKDFSKQLPRGWELCFGESVCPFVLIGLLFRGGSG